MIYVSNNTFFFSRKETEQTFMRDHNHVIKNIDNYISSLKTLATKPSNEIGIMNNIENKSCRINRTGQKF